MTIPTRTMALLAEILDERMKQIAKGFTPEHDDAHLHGELAQAAATLALSAVANHSDELHMSAPIGFPGYMAVAWPLMDADISPDKTVRQFCIAGIAMLLAEVERLDRARDAGAIVSCECGRLAWTDETVVDVDGVVLCPECAAGREIAYAHEPDTVARFLRERCDRDPQASETATDLYAAYRDWHAGQADAGEKFIRTRLAFAKEVQALPWVIEVQAFGTKHWKGLRLRREG